MKKRWLPLLSFVLLLGGCWDEQLFKYQSIVQVAGYEGEPGDITGYFTYSKISKDKIEYTIVSGKGKSLQDARTVTNSKTHQILNLTQIQVVLITDETATHDLYNYLDPFYRYPRNRLNANLAIVEGEMKDYLDEKKEMTAEIPEFYSDILKNAVDTSIIKDIDLQQAMYHFI